MITLITGKRGSGKSTIAQKITKGKVSVWIPNFPQSTSPFSMVKAGVTKATEYLVIDEFTNILDIRELLTIKIIRINIRHQPVEDIPFPNLIFISSIFTKEDFPPIEMEVINCDENFIMGEKYYIRNEGYLGNALKWWKEGHNGYTYDIRQAGKFTKEQAENICKRPQDTAYKCDYIDGLIHAQRLIVDCQYVDDSERFWTINSPN